MVLNWGDFPLPGDIWQYLKTLWVFPGGSNGKKNLSANAGDMRDVGLIPRSGRSLGGGHGNPLQ